MGLTGKGSDLPKVTQLNNGQGLEPQPSDSITEGWKEKFQKTDSYFSPTLSACDEFPLVQQMCLSQVQCWVPKSQR